MVGKQHAQQQQRQLQPQQQNSKQLAQQRQHNIRQAMAEIAKKPGISPAARQRGLHSLCLAYKRACLAEKR